jgi:hypothetical protein
VIAIDVSQALSWITPVFVTLLFDDGTELTARVDAKLSSAAVSAQPGQTLRLVLELGAPLVVLPRRVALGEMDGVPIAVNLGSG